VRDLVDRLLERRLVARRRLAEAAHLADELTGGGTDLVIGGKDVGVAQGLDASTHADNDRDVRWAISRRIAH